MDVPSINNELRAPLICVGLPEQIPGSATGAPTDAGKVDDKVKTVPRAVRMIPPTFAFFLGVMLLATSRSSPKLRPGDPLYAATAPIRLDATQDNPLLCRPTGVEFRWMWADASIIGHWAAELDPLRWSSWESSGGLVLELIGYLSSSRPVEVQRRLAGQLTHTKATYASVRKAVEAFGGKALEQMADAQAAVSSTQDARPLVTPSTFNASVSQQLAHLAGVAYDNNLDDVKAWTCDFCNASGVTAEAGSVKPCYAESCKLHAVVAKFTSPDPFADSCAVTFRGTRPGNYWADLDVALVNAPDPWGCSNCLVHKGFLDDWQDLEESVVQALDASGCDGSPLFVTGHSLGGAIATLAAWSLMHVHEFTLAGVYTYEAPRVGNARFRDEWDAAVVGNVPAFRITVEGDPVTQVPCLFGAFVHTSTEVRYALDGTYEVIQEREASCDELATVTPFLAHWLTPAARAHSWEHLHCDPPYLQGLCDAR